MRVLRFFRRPWVVFLLIAILAAAYVALDRWQRATIFSIELGEARWARPTPTDAEIIDLPVDGDRVRAWYLPAANSCAPTVLYLHGSRWNLNSSVFRMERWREMGVAMLAIDYRGFGESTDRLPSQASAVKDAQAGLEELTKRQPDPTKRFVYGHSLGGAIATQLAAETNIDFAGLILESTFTNVRDMIAASNYRDIPGLRWVVTQNFDSLSRIQNIKQPVLFIHGDADRVVPPEMSEQLYAAAAKRPGGKQVLSIIEHASHSGASRSPGYAETVKDFIVAVSEQGQDEASSKASPC